jgi:hypothetical protein
MPWRQRTQFFNETLCSIKDGAIYDQLCECAVLTKDSFCMDFFNYGAGQGYFANFNFEATKDEKEHILKN